MEKSKYQVWKNGRLTATYVTQSRNAEDMLQQIIQQHQTFDELNYLHYVRVIKITNNEKTVIYTPKDNKFWKENLVDK